MTSRSLLLLLIALFSRAAGVHAQAQIDWQALPGPTSRPAFDVRQRAADLARQSSDFVEKGDLPSAEARLRDALALVPDKAIYHYNLACILVGRQHFDSAMESLTRATELGFTDFTRLESDDSVRPLRPWRAYSSLIAHKADIRHTAALRALDELRRQFGKTYLYDVDEEQKLIFATNTDQATLDALKSELIAQAKSQTAALFENKTDEFIRIVIPSPVDYHRLIHQRNVLGIYEDLSRTLVAERMGQVVTHEFTHALHAADQRAAGQEHPIWLREGLASMYEAGEFDGDELIPHDNFRLAAVQSAGRRNSLIPIERLLKLTAADFGNNSNLAYGQTSSLLLYLYEQKLLRKFYDAYKASYADDSTGAKALEAVTGIKLRELQTAWTTWMLARPPPAQHANPGGALLGVRFTEAIDGLKLTTVIPSGPAGMAGLKAGDVIVGLDARDIRDRASLTPLLATHKPGDEITVKVRREGKYVEVTVVLGKR